MSLITNLTDVVLPGGVATLPHSPCLVLVADAFKGIMWRVETVTGWYLQAIDGPTFKPSDAAPLGVDRVQILGDHLCFTNLATS